MSAQSTDDVVTPVTVPIKNPENRTLATVIADLVLEARQHTIGLRTLYQQICVMEGVVPRSWGVQLVEEKERHLERETQQLESLRLVLG